LNNVAHSSCITVMTHAKFHVHHSEFMLSSSCASCRHFTGFLHHTTSLPQISSTGNTYEVHFTSGVHIHQHHFLCHHSISFHFTDFISYSHPSSIHPSASPENHMHNNTSSSFLLCLRSRFSMYAVQYTNLHLQVSLHNWTG